MAVTMCLLYAIVFLDLIAVGMILPLISAHVRALGGNHIQIGLLGSIYACFQFGSGPLIGSLSDLKGRKYILIVTLALCSVAYTILGLTQSIIVILIIRAILGLFKQTQMLGRAMVPDYVHNENSQGEIYGKMAAISSAGITIGPIIGGHIAEDNPDYGFTLLAIGVGICFVLNSVLASFLPAVTVRSKRPPHTTDQATGTGILEYVSNSLKQSFTQLYMVEWSHYWDAFLFKGLVGFAMGVYYSNYSLYLKIQYDLSPKYIGYIISFQGIVGSMSSYFIGYINSLYRFDEDYTQRNFHIFVLLASALLGMIFSFNIYMYVMWLIPLAVGNAMGRLTTLEMILKRSHGDHRGTLIGASNSVRSISGVIAPMVAGFVGEYFGINYVIYASLMTTSLGVYLSYQSRCKSIKVD